MFAFILQYLSIVFPAAIFTYKLNAMQQAYRVFGMKHNDHGIFAIRELVDEDLIIAYPINGNKGILRIRSLVGKKVNMLAYVHY